jgi:hypothetical protein
MVPLALPPEPIAAPLVVEATLAVSPLQAAVVDPGVSLPLLSEALPAGSLTAERSFQAPVPLMHGLTAAAEPPKDRTVDRSAEFLQLFDRARAKTLEVPAAALEHEFLLVPGFMWDFTPRMFGPNIAELRSMGIRTRLVRVHSLGEVKRNARIVAAAIERSPKKVVLITHSKGGLDAMQALADRPDLVEKVAAFVAIQTPFDGVAFAAPLRYWPTLRVMIQAAARLIRFKWRDLSTLFDDAIGDLLRRSEAAENPPAVPRLVSIVSELGRDAHRAFLPLRLTRAVAKWASGKDSDGFVRPEESVLLNSEVIRLPGMSHSDPVLNLGPLGRPIYDARALTRAVVAYLFP